jgi:hypothetical protein
VVEFLENIAYLHIYIYIYIYIDLQGRVLRTHPLPRSRAPHPRKFFIYIYISCVYTIYYLQTNKQGSSVYISIFLFARKYCIYDYKYMHMLRDFINVMYDHFIASDTVT